MDTQHYLQAAERLCAANGGKLTELRRQVLELVLGYPGVVKAYQVLADLQRDRGAAAPPTVYRALDYLAQYGMLHRVDALNGYIVCHHFECSHQALILACEQCGGVEELDADATFQSLSQTTARAGFVPRAQSLVLTGSCKHCHS
ncbi:transcriptional repressor [Craterilacuibacter sp. RT1T]|uniref:transcriptional repressor n=1 Tax=Craterilacuibacter sp. RT1T TaxID=2942211 RepID=UPI0020C0A343|nr:transcriptional repressor [Craterilacuibacter sp. RT1T]MCL6263141.1 transcriptional repressor [Craterilacuibacter sp. RT1T]